MTGLSDVRITLHQRGDVTAVWKSSVLSRIHKYEVSPDQVGKSDRITLLKDEYGNQLAFLEIDIDFTPYAQED